MTCLQLGSGLLVSLFRYFIYLFIHLLLKSTYNTDVIINKDRINRILWYCLCKPECIEPVSNSAEPFRHVKLPPSRWINSCLERVLDLHDILYVSVSCIGKELDHHIYKYLYELHSEQIDIDVVTIVIHQALDIQYQNRFCKYINKSQGNVCDFMFSYND